MRTRYLLVAILMGGFALALGNCGIDEPEPDPFPRFDGGSIGGPPFTTDGGGGGFSQTDAPVQDAPMTIRLDAGDPTDAGGF
jgi:hypothetical protein